MRCAFWRKGRNRDLQQGSGNSLKTTVPRTRPLVLYPTELKLFNIMMIALELYFNVLEALALALEV
jgi:hypothetical protein